jgi:hypothetical protein
MFNIEKRIRAFRSSPQNDVDAIYKQVMGLTREMETIQQMPNKIEAIVRLFQVISPIQDAGGFKATLKQIQSKNYGQVSPIVIEALETLQKHFENAGRCQFGINRTKVGQPVTADDVWLGNVFGLWTKTAAYWLGREEELKKEERLDISKDPNNPATNWYCIHDYQAGGFVKSHTTGILDNLKVLENMASRVVK